jgi:hypothetical protein
MRLKGMMGNTLRALVLEICAVAIAMPQLAHATCPMHRVIVRGNVQRAGRNSMVRIRLVYSGQQAGDATDESVENGDFTLAVPFFTQSRRAVINGVGEKCDRKPESVEVTLSRGDEQDDSISMDLERDFSQNAAGTYMTTSKIVLYGPVAR